MNTSTVYEDIRSVLFPERRWQYIFHLVVLLVSSAYWVGSFAKLPDSTMAEIVLYRPEGDTELYPVISSLSKFNLGDVQDAEKCGQGLASFPVVSLIPHALAYALFGKVGYVVADLLLSWLFFVVVTVFFRQCNMGALSSLIIGSGLAINALQPLAGKLGESWTHLLSFLNVQVWENGFPNLVELPLYVKRIQRPMITELLLIAFLYLLLKLWRERQLPSLRRGLGMGAMLALLVQGDLYSAVTTGLILAALILWLTAADGWRIPWRFLGGVTAGGILFGSFFLLQRIKEHPDIQGRIGVATYSRLEPLFLPGYAPLIRVGIILALASVVYYAARQTRHSALPEDSLSAKKKPLADAENKKSTASAYNGSGISRKKLNYCQWMSADQQVAIFLAFFLVVSYFAQPTQIFLLGKGAQIYHYLLAIPIYYGYAMIALVAGLVRLAMPAKARGLMQELAFTPGIVGALVLTILFTIETIAAVDAPLSRVVYLQNPRGADAESEPWKLTGDAYRPNLRALEKEFRDNPVLQQTKTISTLCVDANFLLTGFYDKKAFNPYIGETTLTDDEVESRLCELAKIMRLRPEDFGMFVKQTYMLAYWLGGNKYRFATDHKFSDDSDYPPQDIYFSHYMPKQWGWILRLPNSEDDRLMKKYSETLARKSDTSRYPDTIILTIEERKMGLLPTPELYREFYTNQAFSVYLKQP